MSASNVQARASASSGRSDHQTVLHPRGCSAAALDWVLLCHRCGRAGLRRPLVEHSHRGGGSANSQPLGGKSLFLHGTLSSDPLLLGRLLRSQLLSLGLSLPLRFGDSRLFSSPLLG
jgi:hypothetical protein